MKRNPACPHCGGSSRLLVGSRWLAYTCNTSGCRVRFIPAQPVRDVCVDAARYGGCRHTAIAAVKGDA